MIKRINEKSSCVKAKSHMTHVWVLPITEEVSITGDKEASNWCLHQLVEGVAIVGVSIKACTLLEYIF